MNTQIKKTVRVLAAPYGREQVTPQISHIRGERDWFNMPHCVERILNCRKNDRSAKDRHPQVNERGQAAPGGPRAFTSLNNLHDYGRCWLAQIMLDASKIWVALVIWGNTIETMARLKTNQLEESTSLIKNSSHYPAVGSSPGRLARYSNSPMMARAKAMPSSVVTSRSIPLNKTSASSNL